MQDATALGVDVTTTTTPLCNDDVGNDDIDEGTDDGVDDDTDDGTLKAELVLRLEVEEEKSEPEDILTGFDLREEEAAVEIRVAGFVVDAVVGI